MLREQAVGITGVVQIDAALVVGKTGSLTLEAVEIVFILLAQVCVFSLY